MGGDKHEKHKHSVKLPPFVPLFKDSMATDAWRDMSYGARILYVALKARLDNQGTRNGHIFLSQRTAAKEIGADTHQITRWFRELQWYGFIVQTSPHSLGVDGKGKAPHWQLTELPIRDHESKGWIPPTRDYERWNGRSFRARSGQGFGKEKIQKPVGGKYDSASVENTTVVSVENTTPAAKSVGGKYDIWTDPTVGGKYDISRLTIYRASAPVYEGRGSPGRYPPAAATPAYVSSGSPGRFKLADVINNVVPFRGAA